MQFPAAVRPGDAIRVVAPSGPFDRTLALRGMAWLGQRYRVKFDWGLFSKDGFLAGTDERRLAELDQALSDPDAKVVLAARGGYGLTRILHRARLRSLLDAPKWVVGFSDITALHVECARYGLASLHAHNCAGLGRGDAHARQAVLDALEHPTRRREYAGLETWRAGSAGGVLFGGNLTVLATCAAAGRLFVPDGAILALEDVTESSYRLDRMLTALELGGAFDRVAAIVMGDLTDCPTGPHGVDPKEAVRRRLVALGVPVLAGLPFGHGRHNVPLIFGARARVHDGTLTLCP